MRPPAISRSARLAARAVLGGPLRIVEVEAGLIAALRDGKASSARRAGVLARQVVAAFGEGKRPTAEKVAAFFQASPVFRKLGSAASIRETAPRMSPGDGPPQSWDLPAIETLGELSWWLGLSAEQLGWLRAVRRSDEEKAAHHYRHCWIPRRGRPPRLIEAPLPILKGAQQRILRRILDRIPPHPAAHGFRAGHDVVGFAAPHVGWPFVLRMDIEDFFPSLRRARVVRVFLTAGYPDAVAGALADLSTTATPMAFRGRASQDGLAPVPQAFLRRLRRRHLPQGAPTSPALANLAFFRCDARISGLADRFGARYTRYADDLLFSGGDGFRRDARRFEAIVGGILLEEGMNLAHRKTRHMPNSVSQRAAGLVLNAGVGMPRRERDELRAILHNCLRQGPASQNRGGHADFRAHLQGRLAHLRHVHPAGAEKLQAIFDGIEW